MITYVMNEDYSSLKYYDALLTEIGKHENSYYFTSKDQLCEKVEEQSPDVLIMEVLNREDMNTAKKILEKDRSINMILISNNDKLALDAISLPISAFLLKPVSKDDLMNQYAKLRNPLKKILGLR